MTLHRGDLDSGTADRLLSGRLAPDDAPPAYREVARLLTEASAGRDGVDVTMDDALRVAMVEAIRDGAPRSRETWMVGKRRTFRTAAVMAAIIVLSAGTAAASKGNLPDAAQDRLARAAEHFGIDLPHSSDEHDAPDVPLPDVDQPGDDTTGDDDGVGPPTAHEEDGSVVSDPNIGDLSEAPLGTPVPPDNDEHGAPGSGPARVTEGGDPNDPSNPTRPEEPEPETSPGANGAANGNANGGNGSANGNGNGAPPGTANGAGNGGGNGGNAGGNGQGNGAPPAPVPAGNGGVPGNGLGNGHANGRSGGQP